MELALTTSIVRIEIWLQQYAIKTFGKTTPSSIFNINKDEALLSLQLSNLDFNVSIITEQKDLEIISKQKTTRTWFAVKRNELTKISKDYRDYLLTLIE